MPEDAYDVGLTLPLNGSRYERARLTRLPPPNLEEVVFFAEHPTSMMAYEEEEGEFLPEPLQVDRGVAVLEESVELGEADLITQV
jgi:hypothetical protein